MTWCYWHFCFIDKFKFRMYLLTIFPNLFTRRIWTAVCMQRSGDRCYCFMSVSQKLVWIHLIQVYCWDYVQLVEYQITATNAWLLGEWPTVWTLYYTVVYKALNMHLVASNIGCWCQGLIGCLSMTFGGAHGSNVANSLDGACLGPFIYIGILYEHTLTPYISITWLRISALWSSTQ